MMLAALLLILQPGDDAPEDPALACAPRLVMTAAGPPPAIFYARRRQIAPERIVDLSVHRCPGGGFRVERHRTGPGDEARESMQWVPAASCPAMGGWIEAATRISLPAPMLRPHLRPSGRPGTWFTLDARMLTGPGWLGRVALEIQEPPDAPPNALSGWFREGELVFKACRDQGHGGEGYARRRPGTRP